MDAQWKLLISTMTLATLMAPAGAAAQIETVKPSPAARPDFSGVWRHGSLPWLVPPASGPGPVTNTSRRQDDGTSNYNQLVGDFANPILQPWAAEVVRKKGELSLAGVAYGSPSNLCWPDPVPFLFKHMAMEMLQLPNRVVMLFSEDHEVRAVRLNASHPVAVAPSWHGDAVGRYDGDTLIIDTVGVKADRPFGMIDLFGTPYTEKLHVVERYQLTDRAAVKDAIARGAKENWRPGGPVNPNYDDKYLRIDFTVEDPGAFTTPWTATMVYLRDRREWPEEACAENTFGFHHGKDDGIPRAEMPDF